jgi:hypothetical protein
MMLEKRFSILAQLPVHFKKCCGKKVSFAEGDATGQAIKKAARGRSHAPLANGV